MTFATDIEDAVQRNSDTIIGISVGAFGWGSIDDEKPYGIDRVDTDDSAIPKGVVLDWKEVRPLLDYKYNTGHGAPECHAVTVWGVDYVYWVTQYDGATWIDHIPCRPIDHVPQMSGG